MSDIVLSKRLEKKGVYLFLSKYAVLTGWIICFLTLLISDIANDKSIDLRSYILILSPLGILFALCQTGYSWFFPHEITILNDKIVAVGPWKIEHTITFDKIRTVLYNQQSTVIQKKYGMNKIFIGKSIDPSRQIQEKLFEILKGYPGIRFAESAYI